MARLNRRDEGDDTDGQRRGFGCHFAAPGFRISGGVGLKISGALRSAFVRGTLPFRGAGSDAARIFLSWSLVLIALRCLPLQPSSPPTEKKPYTMSLLGDSRPAPPPP